MEPRDLRGVVARRVLFSLDRTKNSLVVFNCVQLALRRRNTCVLSVASGLSRLRKSLEAVFYGAKLRNNAGAAERG